MTANLGHRAHVWLAILLAVALVFDGAVFSALADDGGDDGEWEESSGQWAGDDDGDDSWQAAPGQPLQPVVTAPAGNADDQANRKKSRRARDQSGTARLQASDDDDDDDCEIDDDDANLLTDGFCNDQAIVRLTSGADIEAVNEAHNTETIDAIDGQSAYLLALPSGSDEPMVVDQLSGDGRVAWAELNFVDQAPEGRPQRFFLRGDTVPTEGELTQAYAPALMGVPRGDACERGAGVAIAVVDSGYDPSHPAFASTTVRGAWNAFTNQDGAGNVDDIGNAEDDDGDGYVDEMTGHGTHITGIIAQVAPRAEIVPIKALDSDGVGQAFYLARAVFYAIGQDVDVLNLSLGSTADARIVSEATAAALDAGIFIAAAAGNNGGYEPREYPGTLPGVFGVAATDAQDRRADFTSLHDQIDISAPGVAIVSAFALDQPPNNAFGSPYALWSGTSMATPWVSGAAALVQAQNPSWEPERVAARLQSTAAPINGDADGMGSGRLNVGAAIGCPVASVDEDTNDKKDKKKGKKKGKKGKRHKKGKHRR